MAAQHGEPAVVGKYELLKTIGKGNFAVVTAGRHIATQEQVRLLVYTVAKPPAIFIHFRRLYD